MKIFFLIILFVTAFFLGYVFYFGFALIVRPPFGKSGAETLMNMKVFCFETGIKNFGYSLLIGTILLIIGNKFLFKKIKTSLFIFIIFLIISNLGNVLGIHQYYYGLQTEF
ncbi:hypothetical protein ACN9MN_00285 [Chryseobacterium sp. S-02]|uniref:hypothetical protein n=1 Tax=Chryseobacterium sp. S-02 TaxID=3404064 RepID=UPI003CE7360F